MIMGQFSDKEMKKNTNRGAMLSAMRYALVVGGCILPPPEVKAWQAGADANT